MKKIAFITAAALLISFSGCSKGESDMGYTIYNDFSDPAVYEQQFMPSGVWSNGSMFNCTWIPENCSISDGTLTLTLDGEAGKYNSGEYRSNELYGFGTYSVTMKPAKNDGVVSSFFTYTGESDGNQWDEIDIEFLGKDTTIVQFNYFTAGAGNHEFVYELGFDASEDFHTYAFEWRSDKITWFVDGEAVHTATDNIPQTPGRIMVNLWNGTGVDSWLNSFDGNVPLTAQYKMIGFTEE